MIGVLEAGGTKTDFHWGNGKESGLASGEGLNPYLLDDETIRQRLWRLRDLIAPRVMENMGRIYFYGAGCGHPEPVSRIKSAILQVFPEAAEIWVFSDLLGAARALCGTEPGIASILGTGSNACFFNGNQIETEMVSLGFWLGDEGSGGYLGKRVFCDWLKGRLPAGMAAQCPGLFGTARENALESLYREPEPNRRVAALGGLMVRHRELAYCQAAISASLDAFFSESPEVFARAAEGIPLHFTGSVAWHLQEEIRSCLSRRQWVAGRFLDNPSASLFSFHLQTS